MKPHLDPQHAQQILHMHYLPGLRLAYQELGELIQSLESGNGSEPEPEPAETEYKVGHRGGYRTGRGRPLNGPHWTQTPEGRQRLSVQGRKAWQRKYAEHGTENLGRGGTNVRGDVRVERETRDNSVFRTPEFREKMRRLRTGVPRGAPGNPTSSAGHEEVRRDVMGRKLPAIHWTKTAEGRAKMAAAQKLLQEKHRNDPAWHAKKRAFTLAGWQTRRAKQRQGAYEK